MISNTKIIMVRHGQSRANLENRFAGYSNFDLTELGRTQAELAANYLHNRMKLTPDVIYSSDLLRTHNTAVPFSKLYGLPINDTEELREIYAGKWEGLTFEEIARDYGDDFSVWRNDFANARCTNGESTRELYRRIVSAICRLAELNIGKTILITTHATPIRAIDCYSRAWGEEKLGEVAFVKNTAISIFDYDSMAKKRTLRPLLVGCTEHLREDMTTALPSSV